MTPDEKNAAEQPDGDGETLKGLPFRLDNNPLYLMSGALDRVVANIEAALGPQRFSQTQWRTLAALSEQSPLSIGALSGLTFVEGSALGRAVAKMEKEGLVRRQSDAADRRIVRVALTGQGQARLAELKPVVTGEINRALQSLSQQDLQSLNAFLRAIAPAASPNADAE